MSERDENLSDFIACIPHEIRADWDAKYGPLVAGFPCNILFAKITNGTRSRPQRAVQALYWPSLETFRDGPHRKEMRYFTRPPSEYFIRVIFEKKSGYWRTEKFKGKRLVRLAQGPTFDTAMLHTTFGGPELDEC